ncbi:MAG: DUF4830 domain-containing protein [Ruminococcaceae bacterium]|nr:DUF4830 domain-containing protein [Oscillospiraceae bacterium]
MFVLSITSKKIKYIAAVLLLVIFAGVLTTVSRVQLKKLNTQSVETKTGVVNFKAGNNKERLSFISQFGWEVDSEPEEVAEIIIPQEFDDVYNNYNEIQLKQDCDLREYCGKRVKRWTYIIKNYPGYSETDTCVRINLLIFDGMVIGGDVSSTEISGFMHTFRKE